MKKEIIRRFPAKHGEVTVTAYTENGHTEYAVRHTLPAIETFWTVEPFLAIRHAQFLAAKY